MSEQKSLVSPPSQTLETELAEFARHQFRKFAPRKVLPTGFQVQFYPYAGFNNTIRLRQGILLIRLSDLLKGASPVVRQAVIGILIAKILKKPVPAEYEEAFRVFTQLPSVKTAIERARRVRGFKHVTGEKGHVYDLGKVFQELNHQYFSGEVSQPTLTWSRTQTRRILGHYDRAHHTIVISRTLDDVRVPDYVVAYVLYHEMLHIKHKVRSVNGRNCIHSSEFQREERVFAQYTEAQGWLAELARRPKPRSVRRKSSTKPKS